MAKIPASGAAASFEQIIGWPYESPGSNNKNGIDCSGAWVRCYQQYGKSVYHGSNTIYRKYCTQTSAIASEADLRVGMAIFKNRFDGKEPSQYQGDGIGNMYHIGCVTQINPLRIVHATTPVAKVDYNTNNNWTHWGLMNEVEYSDAPGPTPTPDAEVVYTAKVTTDSGSLNMRTAPDLSASLILQIPRNALVDVLQDDTVWLRVRYQGKSGYSMMKFLRKA